MKLGEILIRKKLISKKQMLQVIASQLSCGKRLGELLIEYGLISAEDIALALREQYWRAKGFWVID
ncbi:MAG: hypothetical protein F6K10_18155 [Moorea sp. SIO2B7]|nr:hypothetical protein [Moorena sp. SIO2B7]